MKKISKVNGRLAPIGYPDRSYVRFEVEDEKVGAVIRTLDPKLTDDLLTMVPGQNKMFDVVFVCDDKNLETVHRALEGMVGDAIRVSRLPGRPDHLCDV
jgi:hypothetical protein